LKRYRDSRPRADPEDVVIAADDPERAVGLKEPPGSGEPFLGETVVRREIGETVPGFLDALDLAVIGAVKLPFQLQVIGRVGEDHVDGGFRQSPHQLDAIAAQNAVGQGLDHGGAA
jgi:hypothetical protein